MNLRDLRASLLRRWYLVVLGLLGTAALAVLALGAVGPSYVANASVVLIPGKATIAEGGNPLLYMGSLVQARDVLVRSLTSDEVLVPITKRFPGVTISVASDATTSGPMIAMSTTGADPSTSVASLDVMLAEAGKQLDQLQAEVDVSDDAKMSALTLTADAEATADDSARLKIVGAAVIAGLAATVLVTGALDGLLLARRARRQRRLDQPTRRRKSVQRPAETTSGADETPTPAGTDDLVALEPAGRAASAPQ